MWARQILKKIIQFCLSGISKTQVVYLYQIKYIFMNTSTIIVCVYVSALKKYILTSVTTEMIRKKINQVNFYTNMTLNMFDKTFKIGISVQCI